MSDRPQPLIGGDVRAGWLRHGIGFSAGGLAASHQDRLTLALAALAIVAVLAWSAAVKHLPKP